MSDLISNLNATIEALENTVIVNKRIIKLNEETIAVQKCHIENLERSIKALEQIIKNKDETMAIYNIWFETDR